MPQHSSIPSFSSSHKPCPLPSPNPTRSFWHSEPDSFLIGHRTTKELPEYAEIVIVGSGITGASAGRWFTEMDDGGKWTGDDGLLMLEAREACWGATGRNGGHLQPLLYEQPHRPEVAAFEQKNCAEVASYVAENEIPCEFRSVAGCRTFWTEQLLSEAVSSVEELKKVAPDVGKDVTVVLEKEGLKAAQVQEECLGATLTKGAASLWPYKYVSWILKKLIQDKKLNLQTNTPVERIESINSSAARYKIHTPRGPVLAKHVLLATNAYTSHLLPSFADLIVPVRETMTALTPPPAMKSLLPHTYGFVGFGTDPNPNSTEYLIQRPFSDVPNPKGHLMLGGGRIAAATLPSVGEADDSVIDGTVVEFLQAALPKALELGAAAPPLLDADMAWTGIWAASRDEMPWVGQVPGRLGLWLCAAYTGHGMPNATLCARAVVRLIVADQKGEDVGGLTEAMVGDGEIPQVYLLTEKRMAVASGLASVEVQDAQRGIGLRARGT